MTNTEFNKEGPETMLVAKTAEAAAKHAGGYPALSALPRASLESEDGLTDLVSRIVDRTVARVLTHLAVPPPVKNTPPPPPIAPPPAVSMNSIPPDRQAMTLREAAKVIGCCKRTLERERDSGEIRCFRIGNRWRVSVSEINAYIRRREKAG